MSGLRSTVYGLRSSKGGFTLIELIVVTLIFAILMVAAATSMDYLIPKYRLRGAAREIGAIMKEARSRAIGSGRDVYLVYDLSGNKYWILAAFPVDSEIADPDAPPPAVPKGYVYDAVFIRPLPEGVDFVDVQLGKGVFITAGEARIRIPPYGIAEHHIVNMTLARNSDRQLAVRLNGFTGHLTFYDHYKKPDELLEDSGN